MCLRYLLADYLVPALVRRGDSATTVAVHDRARPRKGRKRSAPQVRNYRLCQAENGVGLHVVFHHRNYGNLLIEAPSQRLAYDMAEAIRGSVSLFIGEEADHHDGRPFLFSVARAPDFSWSEDELLSAVAEVDPWFDESSVRRLYGGSLLLDECTLRLVAQAAPTVVADQRLLRAVIDFQQSRSLFYGYMSYPDYMLHYIPERNDLTQDLAERLYLENRGRYELAFVASFKAIESILGANQITKTQLRSLFDQLPYEAIQAHTEYTRRFEHAHSLSRQTDYHEMVSHFLDIRNAVAAHSNRQPPEHLAITRDTLYEIQFLVRQMVTRAVAEVAGEDMPELPSEAYVDVG